MKRESGGIQIESVFIIAIAAVIIVIASLVYAYNVKLLETQAVQKVEASK